MAIDGIEIPRAGESVPTLHGADCDAQAESRFRPFSRRRFRTMRPARVAMRARKPCLRLRRRTFG